MKEITIIVESKDMSSWSRTLKIYIDKLKENFDSIMLILNCIFIIKLILGQLMLNKCQLMLNKCQSDLGQRNKDRMKSASGDPSRSRSMRVWGFIVFFSKGISLR